MSAINNYWKVPKLFALVAVAAAFSSSLSHAIAVQEQAISELTIEERLTKVREVLKHREKASASEPNPRSSLLEKPEIVENKLLLSQWRNYWSDWPNYWNDWSDWNNGPWSDWNDWSDWNNGPWSDWNDWSDWGN